MSSPPTVTGQSILQSQSIEPQDVKVEHLPPLQQAGIWIVLGLGIVGLIIIGVTLAQWWFHLPQIPSLLLPHTADNEAVNTKIVANYKALVDATTASPSALFDQMIVKVLYPLLTLVLGYVFGSRGAESR